VSMTTIRIAIKRGLEKVLRRARFATWSHRQAVHAKSSYNGKS
jgi:hypothetical protein